MFSRIARTLLAAGLFAASSLIVARLRADEPAAAASNNGGDENIVYMTKERDVWIDKQKKQVVLKGKVAVREGNLEMLACPEQTKEYESIIALSAHEMENVHAALLAIGAQPGHPARFDTTFHPPTGTHIDVTIRWTDKEGKKHEARGQDWVRNLKTHKPLEYSWVFAGSRFVEDPETHEKHYAANDGDFISVVNFADSAIDLSFESPKDWSEHVFEPFTEHIPPKGTEVEVVLTPKLQNAEKK
ncbi:MAG TPA: YdjY domain-containing protein [Pirellulales bacterium]|nr:YdjY domain-containing protein [Pirellulales bacterium]